MTIQEFDKTKWGVGMKAIYHNENAGSNNDKEFDISSVDFQEKLVGLEEGEWDTDEEMNKYWNGKIKWVRCENIELLNNYSTGHLVENE